MGVLKSLKKLLQKMNLGDNVLDYICGSEALPLPYSAEEESDLLGKLSGGDERVKSDLVEHNLRLVVYIARKFENTGADADDLVSVGTIGLIKAINSFKPDKNIKLATYASRCIENEILMYLRRLVRLRSEVSFDEPLNTDWEGNELLLSDILGCQTCSARTATPFTRILKRAWKRNCCARRSKNCRKGNRRSCICVSASAAEKK